MKIIRAVIVVATLTVGLLADPALAVEKPHVDQERELLMEAKIEANRVEPAVVALPPPPPTTTTTAPPAPEPEPASAPATGDVWAALAQCEAWGTNANTGNGYYGYFQFSLGTWHSVGGTGYPTDHDYATQVHFAQILQQRSGWGQWPACSLKLGLR